MSPTHRPLDSPTLDIRRFSKEKKTPEAALRLLNSEKGGLVALRVRLMLKPATALAAIRLSQLYKSTKGGQDPRLSFVLSYLVEEGVSVLKHEVQAVHRQFTEREAKAMGLRVVSGRRYMTPHGKSPDGR